MRACDMSIFFVPDAASARRVGWTTLTSYARPRCDNIVHYLQGVRLCPISWLNSANNRFILTPTLLYNSAMHYHPPLLCLAFVLNTPASPRRLRGCAPILARRASLGLPASPSKFNTLLRFGPTSRSHSYAGGRSRSSVLVPLRIVSTRFRAFCRAWCSSAARTDVSDLRSISGTVFPSRAVGDRVGAVLGRTARRCGVGAGVNMDVAACDGDIHCDCNGGCSCDSDWDCDWDCGDLFALPRRLDLAAL